MTQFEELAKELGVKIEVDDKGLYKGMAKALAKMTNEVIMSDDIEIFHMEWEEQKELVKKEFYRVFPYMRKTEQPTPAFPVDYEPEEGEY